MSNSSNVNAKPKILNFITGTSAGALTALYFAQLHDRYVAGQEDPDAVDQPDPFYRMVKSSLPILSELLPDGVEKPLWKRILGKLKIWGWNIPVHNGLYDSSSLFRQLFNPEILASNLETAIAITAYIPTIDASVIYVNKELDQIKQLKPEIMPHDVYRYDPSIPVWVMASQSSAIPLQFFNVPLLLPLDQERRDNCDAECTWYNFPGTGADRKWWQITGRGLIGVHGGNATGFAVEDGAVTTNLGAVASCIDRNKVIIAINPIKKASNIEDSFDKRWRIAQWKLFIGPIYQIIKAALFLLTDSSNDKRQVLANYYMKIENDSGPAEFVLPTVIEIDCTKTRKELSAEKDKEFPDWKSFNQYDYDITHSIFDKTYHETKQKIQQGLFSAEDIFRYSNEGLSICVSGGGAAAVDEVATVAAILDAIAESRLS